MEERFQKRDRPKKCVDDDGRAIQTDPEEEIKPSGILPPPSSSPSTLVYYQFSISEHIWQRLFRRLTKGKKSERESWKVRMCWSSSTVVHKPPILFYMGSMSDSERERERKCFKILCKEKRSRADEVIEWYERRCMYVLYVFVTIYPHQSECRSPAVFFIVRI